MAAGSGGVRRKMSQLNLCRNEPFSRSSLFQKQSSCKHSHIIVCPPRLRIKNGDPSTQTQVRKHECLPLNRVNKRYPQLMWKKKPLAFDSCGKNILPSTLHSCKHSHIIVRPPKAPDQKWRPFHTDSGAKT